MSAVLTDVGSGLATIGIMGPRSREFLQSLTPDDLSNEAFPFGTSQLIEIGGVPVRAIRMTYEGELGWELYVATTDAVALHDAIVDAGEPHGLTHAGFHAMNSPICGPKGTAVKNDTPGPSLPVW